ncbi:MAG TPA: monovalent cation/H(+) antiporter subunit G [Bryobacteraceae bacterium]|nr:monovalent cation/H(+) antiporter subunit G [Bryobacteraceae bacterium]HPQ14500.1 monovalent cation/H(+) antiporter subunit G [Bryobacteraceae bacterium]
MSVTDGIAAILLLAGSAFVLLASLGLWRFDDFYSRIHAATKATTLGVLFVVAAAALRVEAVPDLLKLFLAAVLQLISAPVTGNMLGRAAYWAGIRLTPYTMIDELRDSGLEH